MSEPETRVGRHDVWMLIEILAVGREVLVEIYTDNDDAFRQRDAHWAARPNRRAHYVRARQLRYE